jgi:hypothetical protein
MTESLLGDRLNERPEFPDPTVGVLRLGHFDRVAREDSRDSFRGVVERRCADLFTFVLASLENSVSDRCLFEFLEEHGRVFKDRFEPCRILI